MSSKFIRIVQHRDLPWEKDSIARAAYDPEHIPDCNVQATVGKHFLFHEEIPKAANGQGYLRVTKKSLWWKHEHFPTVWTSEGLTTCMENGYQWTINSTTWNHLRMMWLAAETTDNEEFKGREEAAEQECEAEREPLKNEERRQNKKTKREVAQLLDEKELPDEQQLRKEQKRLNGKEPPDEKGLRREEP